MIRRFWVVGVAGLAGVMAAGLAVGQEPKKDAPPAGGQEMPVPKPGPEHEVLKHEVGTWDATMEMKDPSGKTQTAKAVETNTLLGEGLWRIQDFKGELMGAPFHGHGVMGYDPARKKYVGTWVDSMTAAPSSMEGTYDAKTKTMTVWMEGPGPDGKNVKMRSTTQYKDDGSRVFTMFSPEGAGPEMTMMTVTYKKRK